MTSHQKGLIFAHITAVLFGMTGVLGALIQSDAGVITFGRASFALISLYIASVMLSLKLTHHISRRLAYSLTLSGVMLSIHWITFFVGIKMGSVAMATLGFASFPAFITLIERIVLRDKISVTSWVLVLVVMLGLILVSPSIDPKLANTKGLLWGIISGFSFACLAVTNRTIGYRLNPISIAFWQNLVVAVTSFPLIFFASLRLSPSDWLWLGVLGIICTALSHFLFVSSIQRINARTAGLIISLEPVYAIIVAWWLFNEEPTLKMIIGGVLIIGAAIYPKTNE